MRTPVNKVLMLMMLLVAVSATASAFVSPIGSLFETKPSENWVCTTDSLGDEVCVLVTDEEFSRDTIIPSDYTVAPGSMFDINLKIALYDFVDITSAELTIRRSGSSTIIRSVDFTDQTGFHIPGQLRNYYFSGVIAPTLEGDYIIEYRVRGRRSLAGSITTLGYSFESISVDSSAAPLGQVACGVCQGDVFQQVNLERSELVKPLTWWEKLLGVSREGSDGLMCDGNTYQERNLHAWSTLTSCKNGFPVSNLDYFQPEIKSVSINVDGDAILLDIPDMGMIPYDLLKDLGVKEGDYVNVIVEIDNSRAKPFKESSMSDSQIAQLNAIAKDIREFPTVNPDANWFVRTINRDFFQTLISPIPLFKRSMIEFVADGIRPTRGAIIIDEARSQFIHAAPYLNHAILEVGFYAPNAAPQGYSYYSRAGFTDETLKTQTIRDIRACMEEESRQGWINSYSLLITPPIERPNGDIEYWTYSDVDWGRMFRGAKLGGANNIIIEVPVKIPQPGDKLDMSVTGRTAAEADNYNPDGEYYLHVAVFDRCWSPTLGSPDYLQVKGYTLQLPETSNGEAGTCCKTGYLLFGNSKHFYASSTQQCTEIYGGRISNDALNQCTDEAPLLREGSCFLPETISGGYVKLKDISETARTAKQCLERGGYTSEGEARQAAGVTGQPFTQCFSATDKITGTTELQVRKHTIYGTNTCDDVPGHYSEITRESVNELGWQVTTCYVCDAQGTGGNVILGDDQEPKWYNVDVDPITTCESLNAVTEELVDSGICNAGQGAVLHPGDDTRWCFVQEGKTVEEACEEKSYPRKDHIKINELYEIGIILKEGPRSVDVAVEMESWLENERLPVIPIVAASVGCKDGSTYVRAINSDERVYRDNKLVYDALKQDLLTPLSRITTAILADWWMYLGTGQSGTELGVTQWGVCVTDETDLWTAIRTWFADLLGVEYDEPIVVVVIVASGLFIFVIISQLTKPKRPPQGYGGYE